MTDAGLFAIAAAIYFGLKHGLGSIAEVMRKVDVVVDMRAVETTDRSR